MVFILLVFDSQSCHEMALGLIITVGQDKGARWTTILHFYPVNLLNVHKHIGGTSKGWKRVIKKIIKK